MTQPRKTRTKKPKARTGRERTAAYRAKMRAQGLRRIEMWLPDTRTPEFAAEARRQSLLIANSERDKEDQDFVEAIADWGHE